MDKLLKIAYRWGRPFFQVESIARAIVTGTLADNNYPPLLIKDIKDCLVKNPTLRLELEQKKKRLEVNGTKTGLTATQMVDVV